MLAYLIKGNYLCGMAGTRQVDISVPEEIYAECCRWVYTKKYEHDTKGAVILQVLRANTKTPLNKVIWILKKEHNIEIRRIRTIKDMAERCGIDYTP